MKFDVMHSSPSLRAFVAATALAAVSLGAAAQSLVIQSCASGPPISLSADDGRAMLDNADRQQVHIAILRRYPALAADGFEPQQILMWHKTADKWLYASLIPSQDHPETMCFTATFSAEIFDFTPALTQKYFFAGTERS